MVSMIEAVIQVTRVERSSMTAGLARWRRHVGSTHHLSRALRFATLIGITLCLMALPSCAPSPTIQHPKLRRYATASEAEKINIQLLRLEYRVRAEGRPLVATASAMGISTIGDSIGLEIIVSPLDANIVRKFQFPGVKVRHVSMQYRRVLLVVNELSSLYDLARIPEVRVISPEYGVATQAIPNQEAELTLAEPNSKRVTVCRTGAIHDHDVYFGGGLHGC